MLRFFKRRPRGQHIGPRAEEFAAAFGVGESDQRINMVDAFGVTLTAIQALHQIVQERESRLVALEARLAALEGKRKPGR